MQVNGSSTLESRRETVKFNDVGFLGEILGLSKLVDLDLGFVGLGDVLGDAISSLLKTQNALKSIKASQNKMQKNSALKIAAAFAEGGENGKGNGNGLEELDLSSNFFTLAGSLAIVTALRNGANKLHTLNLENSLCETRLDEKVIQPETRSFLHRNFAGVGPDLVVEAARRKALFDEAEEIRLIEEEDARILAQGGKPKKRKPKKKKAKKKGRAADNTPIPMRFFVEILKEQVKEEEEKKARELELELELELEAAGDVKGGEEKKGGKGNGKGNGNGKGKGVKEDTHMLHMKLSEIKIEEGVNPCSWQKKLAGGEEENVVLERTDAHRVLKEAVDRVRVEHDIDILI